MMKQLMTKEILEEPLAELGEKVRFLVDRPAPCRIPDSFLFLVVPGIPRRKRQYSSIRTTGKVHHAVSHRCADSRDLP